MTSAGESIPEDRTQLLREVRIPQPSVIPQFGEIMLASD